MSTGPVKKGNFKHTGDLYDCHGCGAHCNMCRYREAAQKVLTKKELPVDEDAPKSPRTIRKLKKKAEELEAKELAIDERKAQNDENCDKFAKKFGLLKKANVLMFYGRSNDAFDEIAKAAAIIKEQWED